MIFHMGMVELQRGKRALISSNKRVTSWIRGIPPEEGWDAREEPVILKEHKVPEANAFKHGLPAQKMPLWELEKSVPSRKSSHCSVASPLVELEDKSPSAQ